MFHRGHSEFPSGGSINRGGGFRAVFHRIFGDAEHPLTWAITIGVVAGVRIRVHLLFIVYLAAQMLWSINQDFYGPKYTAIAMGLLFTIVLLHEFGHVLACRWIGGEADEVLLWPLGGLANCNPPDHWRAHLLTTLGGPGVNLLIVPITAVALWLAGAGSTILFNPLDISTVYFSLTSWWLVALWTAHALNLALLVFNMVLPIFPLDGGRTLQAILWRSHGRRQSMLIVTMVGLAVAGVLAIFSLVAGMTMLLGVAIFGALVSWTERQRLLAPDAITGDYDLFTDLDDGQAHAGQLRQERRARKESEREQREQAELDRILARIASAGLESLSRREKRTLQKATNQRRRRGGG